MLEPRPVAHRPRIELDEPRAQAFLRRGPLTISGWALFPSSPTARVDVQLGGHSLGPARPCLPRPDVRDATGLPLGATAGFELTADLTGWPGANGDTTLEVTATSAVGERLDLTPMPVTIGSKPRLVRPSEPILKSGQFPGPPILVFNHRLDIGGAQLNLVELLSELVGLGAASPVVVSAIDGPIRDRLEKIGIPVHISGVIPVDDGRSYRERVEKLALWSRDGNFAAAIVNTATSHSLPGADVAAQLGIPTIWTIQESIPPALLWSYLDSSVRRRAEETLKSAARLVFHADATRRLYEPAASPARCVTLGVGVDLAPIDALRDRFDRAAERSRVGIPANADLVLCVGTVEKRKSQLALVQAFELVAERHPRAHLVLVGGQDTAYSRSLRDYLDSHASTERIRLVDLSLEVQHWYGMSDFYVCASDIECLPRTVLEAMAWEKPTLATEIYGLPDMVEDGRTGWLCEPRDVSALAAGLERALLSSAEERAAFGANARALMEERYSAKLHGLEFARLLNEIIGEPAAAEI
jgi:glycosyltransferase involved in cell wall biosynthesis